MQMIISFGAMLAEEEGIGRWAQGKNGCDAGQGNRGATRHGAITYCWIVSELKGIARRSRPQVYI